MKLRLALAVLAFAGTIAFSDIIHGKPDFGGLGSLTAGFVFCALYFSAAAWRRLFGLMLGLSVAISLVAAYQIEIMPRAHGIFASANFLGGYAALHIFIALFMRARSKSPGLFDISVLFNAMALALSQSRGAILACIVGIMFGFTKKRLGLKLATGAIGALCFVGLSLGRSPVSIEARVSNLYLGWLVLRQHAILGVGQGIIFNHFYNVALEWMVAGGIVALLAGIWLVAEAFLLAVRTPNKAESAALVAFLVCWATNGLFIFDTAATAVPLFIVLAYLGSIDRDVAHAASFINNQQALHAAGQGATRGVDGKGVT